MPTQQVPRQQDLRTATLLYLHTRMLAQFFHGAPHIRHREEGTDLLCAFSQPGVGVLNVDPSCAHCTPESAGFVGRRSGGTPTMMGEQPRTESLFYYFRLEDQIPEDHLLRLLDHLVDFSFVRERLKSFYSSTGRPSIDPEVLLRLLLVGYLYGITSERRLLEEVKMHLAYRWFTRLGFEQEIPDHSTFSKNRLARFRQSGVFREVFEEIVRRCLEAGLVEGQNLAVDGTMVGANARRQSRVPREQLKEAAQVSRTVREYLAELEQANPVAESEELEEPPGGTAGSVSTTDPDAAWTAAKGGPALLAYYDNYLIDA